MVCGNTSMELVCEKGCLIKGYGVFYKVGGQDSIGRAGWTVYWNVA